MIKINVHSFNAPYFCDFLIKYLIIYIHIVESLSVCLFVPYGFLNESCDLDEIFRVCRTKKDRANALSFSSPTASVQKLRILNFGEETYNIQKFSTYF